MKKEESGILQPEIVLLDTECSRTLVRRDLVDAGRRISENSMCTWRYSVVQVKSVVSDNLPMGVLLGTDVPYLSNPLGKRLQKNRKRMYQKMKKMH